jgi:hypothetical protein
MADGRSIELLEESASPPGVTGDLDDYTSYFEHNLVETDAALRGSVLTGVPSVIAQNVLGRRQRLWDQIFFGIIHVIPRVKDVGGVVTQVSFQVEVWNADEISHRGNSVGVTGSDGVTIGSGPTLPTFWPPFSSYFTTIVVSPEGDPVIDSLVTWVFPGFTGTDTHVLGVRLTVYPLPHNWAVELKETFGHLTTVTQAKNGNEQRRSLRTVPRRVLDLAGLASSSQEAAYMLAKLLNEGRLLFTVPYWPDASHPTADIASGATSIAIDTTTRIYEAGDLAVLWKDTMTWEAVKILSVSPSALVLQSPTAAAWPKGTTTVAPLLPARPTGDIAPEELRPGLYQIDAQFETEPR